MKRGEHQDSLSSYPLHFFSVHRCITDWLGIVSTENGHGGDMVFSREGTPYRCGEGSSASIECLSTSGHGRDISFSAGLSNPMPAGQKWPVGF